MPATPIHKPCGIYGTIGVLLISPMPCFYFVCATWFQPRWYIRFWFHPPRRVFACIYGLCKRALPPTPFGDNFDRDTVSHVRYFRCPIILGISWHVCFVALGLGFYHRSPWRCVSCAFIFLECSVESFFHFPALISGMDRRVLMATVFAFLDKDISLKFK